MMYLRFLFLMSAGMLGVGLVLTTLLDSFFSDWSLENGVRHYLDEMSRKTRFIQVHDYDQETAVVRTRLMAVKTPLPKEIRLVEAAGENLPLPPVAARRAQMSTAPKISWLTPLPPPTRG